MSEMWMNLPDKGIIRHIKSFFQIKWLSEMKYETLVCLEQFDGFWLYICFYEAAIIIITIITIIITTNTIIVIFGRVEHFFGVFPRLGGYRGTLDSSLPSPQFFEGQTYRLHIRCIYQSSEQHLRLKVFVLSLNWVFWCPIWLTQLLKSMSSLVTIPSKAKQ